ncbi:hypothetical protein IHQ68_04815 [Chelatococcus sambhunathii]|uniref:Uncharacterized protein n=1 Tax=Chelatococcus sambhunathii TaxID=363953 RepID=A0ABU1DD04_9HYPH|nr:hypothetical protein [Chelatococcus sambhunathii]MDR4305946.1 hypothetical protein [Chelatococcus sambhunathii]
MSKDPNWYWYRQTKGGRPGAWVICGPFTEERKAKADRERDKQDGDVGIVFSAPTREEALKQTHFQ